MSQLKSPQELHTQLLEQHPPTVIDVRGEEEFRAGNIAGARHVPADEIERFVVQIPKDRPVVVY